MQIDQKIIDTYGLTQTDEIIGSSFENDCPLYRDELNNVWARCNSKGNITPCLINVMNLQSKKNLQFSIDFLMANVDSKSYDSLITQDILELT